MIQIHSDKTATTPKENATVVYSIQIVQIILTKDFQRFLINHGNTIVVLLPVLASASSEETRDDDTPENCDEKCEKTIIPHTDELHQDAKIYEKEIMIEILYTCVERICEPLSKVLEDGFTTSSKTKKWRCYPGVILY